jgi:hypothetical protein
MPLTTTNEQGHFNNDTYNIYFFMNDGRRRIRAGISSQALEKLEPEVRGRNGLLPAFDKHRARIEREVSAKYDRGELTILNGYQTVLLFAADVP